MVASPARACPPRAPPAAPAGFPPLGAERMKTQIVGVGIVTLIATVGHEEIAHPGELKHVDVEQYEEVRILQDTNIASTGLDELRALRWDDGRSRWVVSFGVLHIVVELPATRDYPRDD